MSSSQQTKQIESTEQITILCDTATDFRRAVTIVEKEPCCDGDHNFTKFVTTDANSNKFMCVLYSPGYGVGWSTRENKNVSKFRIIADSDLIQFVVDESFRTKFIKNMKKNGLIPEIHINHTPNNTLFPGYCSSSNKLSHDDLHEIKHAVYHILKCDIDRVPIPDFNDLRVGLVPVGHKFRICEYDGSESIEIFDASKWFDS